ncbi:hypothetical protein ACIBP6_37125 [Nonomuraea terrae]|uniref:hypothetical protein n=1 Tax=Nonomuraea terrae TaxID=2530383 RepID=UPI00378A76A7
METEIEHHHDSHRHLIDVHTDVLPDLERSGGVDAVVVPTIRPPEQLRHAIELASALDCVLVTLHSQKSDPRLARDMMPPGLRFIAIGVDDPAQLDLPDFATTALLRATPLACATDLSAKRNTGLLLARLMGWRRILFLDDDIEVGGPEDVRRAAALLDGYDAVGMQIDGFPDNSVVCHAHRLTGGKQDWFVAGGALAVDTGREPSFFPDIYNEDWFYLLGEKSLRRLAVTGSVKQCPYDPFDHPARALHQEFGDVLAEGVYWLLDEGESWRVAAEEAYWEKALARRREFIDDVWRRVKELSADLFTNRSSIEASVSAASDCHVFIKPELCVRYLNAWAEDRRRWADHIDKTPYIGSSAQDVKKHLIRSEVEKFPLFASFDS